MSPPSLSLCSQPVAVVTAIAEASKRGPSLSYADAAPMSHAGAAPAASKPEAESKVEAEARLSGLTGRLRVGGVEPAQLLPVGAAALPDSQSHRSRASLPSREGRSPRSSSLELPDGDWFGLGVIF
jgi:hypothetical protein